LSATPLLDATPLGRLAPRCQSAHDHRGQSPGQGKPPESDRRTLRGKMRLEVSPGTTNDPALRLRVSLRIPGEALWSGFSESGPETLPDLWMPDPEGHEVPWEIRRGTRFPQRPRARRQVLRDFTSNPGERQERDLGNDPLRVKSARIPAGDNLHSCLTGEDSRDPPGASPGAGTRQHLVIEALWGKPVEESATGWVRTRRRPWNHPQDPSGREGAVMAGGLGARRTGMSMAA
jgi:hypothetical protein